MPSLMYGNMNRKSTVSYWKKYLLALPTLGYSADGKANATRMSLDAICKFFQIEGDYNINAPAPASPIIHAKNHEEAILQMYNPVEDSTRLKNQPELFETLRGDYPLRREETAYLIKY